MHIRNTIQSLIKIGRSKTEIGKLIGCHRNTVRNIGKEDPVKEKVSRNKSAHPLDRHRELIESWLEKKISLTRIHEELQKEYNYPLGYDSIRRYIKSRKIKPNPVYTVLNTEPGEEAQVDFGYLGRVLDEYGKNRKAYVFAMIMSYSRKKYFEVVFDQKVETFIQCHINALGYFGGVPKLIKIDNLKAAILEASFYEPKYQREYAAFAGYYGFISFPCKARHPEVKGKVESGIKYVKGNFMAGRKFKNHQDLEQQLQGWQENICNQRVHGTTRKIPAKIFLKEEQNKLKSLPQKAWEIYRIEKRSVKSNCHIFVGKNYYSVPYKYVGETVIVKISSRMVRIYYKGEEVRRHSLVVGVGQYKTIEEDYPEWKRISETEYQRKQEERMKDIGESAHDYFKEIMKRYPYHWGGKINGIVQLSRRYGKEAVNLSCQRAADFEVYSYRSIANICRKGLFREQVAEQVYGEVTKKKSSYIKEGHSKQTAAVAKVKKRCLARPLSYYSQLFISLTLIIWNILITLCVL